MKMSIVLAVAVAICLVGISESQTQAPYIVVCYFGSWANYRNGRGKFVVEDINPYLCSHIIYRYARLGRDNRIAVVDPYLDLKENSGLGAFERFNNLKQSNSALKTLLAIGGWNEDSDRFSSMASRRQSRKTFIDSCVVFLEKHGFDGLDLDWQFPANRGGSPADKSNYGILVQELKQAFLEHHLLITAAVSGSKNIIDTAYNVPAISRHLDFINLMTYDFHGAWENVTGLNAPLYARENETAEERTLNVGYAVNYWIRRGAPARKLILGIPMYGRSFTLQRTRPHGIGAPTSGTGTAGPFTREPGVLGYNEICANLEWDDSWSVVFDDEARTPYAFKDRQWVSFDNVESIEMKTEFIKSRRLGGATASSIETDDFKNNCGDGNYPLLTTITRELNGQQW